MIFRSNFVSSFLIQHGVFVDNLSWFSGGGVNLFAFRKRRLMAGVRRHLTDITGSLSISYAISDRSRGGLIKIDLRILWPTMIRKIDHDWNEESSKVPKTICYTTVHNTFPNIEGREGVKWELGLALLWTGKMGFTHWDWDLATGNGMNNYKMGMGFLFFSGLCSNILK